MYVYRKGHRRLYAKQLTPIFQNDARPSLLSSARFYSAPRTPDSDPAKSAFRKKAAKKSAKKAMKKVPASTEPYQYRDGMFPYGPVLQFELTDYEDPDDSSSHWDYEVGVDLQDVGRMLGQIAKSTDPRMRPHLIAFAKENIDSIEALRALAQSGDA